MKKYYYYSEMGCVKIGKADFNMWFLNGKGEGTYWVYIDKINKNHNRKDYNFLSQIDGKDLFIYESETSKKPITRLPDGKNNIYSRKGDIIIETVQ